MALFVLSSKDGWVNIMYTGLDAVGVDMQPIENYNEWRLLYFISFLLLVAFFVLNMFVGVVVENFHRCREEQEKEERQRRAEKRAKKLEKRRKSMALFNAYYYKYYYGLEGFSVDLPVEPNAKTGPRDDDSDYDDHNKGTLRSFFARFSRPKGPRRQKRQSEEEEEERRRSFYLDPVVTYLSSSTASAIRVSAQPPSWSENSKHPFPPEEAAYLRVLHDLNIPHIMDDTNEKSA